MRNPPYPLQDGRSNDKNGLDFPTFLVRKPLQVVRISEQTARSKKQTSGFASVAGRYASPARSGFKTGNPQARSERARKPFPMDLRVSVKRLQKACAISGTLAMPSTATATDNPPANAVISNLRPPKRKGLAQNPFLAELLIETRTRSTGELLQSEAVYDDAGQLLETRHYLTKSVDRAEFVKVLSRSYRDLFELGKAGQRMFWYLVEVVQRSPCSDEIYLYWRKVIEFNGDTRTRNGKGTSRISKAAFYDGIKQLQAAGFIARQDRPHFFWLNPRRLWNGSRVSFVETLQAGDIGHLTPDEKPKVMKPGEKKPRAKRNHLKVVPLRPAA